MGDFLAVSCSSDREISNGSAPALVEGGVQDVLCAAVLRAAAEIVSCSCGGEIEGESSAGHLLALAVVGGKALSS